MNGIIGVKNIPGGTNLWIGLDDDKKLVVRLRHEKYLFIDQEINAMDQMEQFIEMIPDHLYVDISFWQRLITKLKRWWKQ